MAKSITINRQNGNEKSGSVTLRNGDLIIVLKKYIYLVSSFATKKEEKSNYSSYCVFINLESGEKMFYEPCSRQTTWERIMSHIANHFLVTSKDVEIIHRDKYSITLNIDSDDN
jgi:hypothetical protein